MSGERWCHVLSRENLFFSSFPQKEKQTFRNFCQKNQTKYSNVVIELSSRFHGNRERKWFQFFVTFLLLSSHEFGLLSRQIKQRPWSEKVVSIWKRKKKKKKVEKAGWDQGRKDEHHVQQWIAPHVNVWTTWRHGSWICQNRPFWSRGAWTRSWWSFRPW